MPSVIPAVLMIETVRTLLAGSGFLARHRCAPSAFTRERKLPFKHLVLLVLQKSLKSLQLHLQEFFERLGGVAGEAATAGAWTQARAKLRHTAFIELNEVAVLAPLEAVPEALGRWQGHRLLAFDSSLLRLPANAQVWAHFGGQEAANQSGPCGVRVPQARLSVLYDVRNRLGLDTKLGGFATGEEALAQSQLGALRTGDLVLVDRGYAGYAFFAHLLARGAQFVGRCPPRRRRGIAGVGGWASRRSFAAAAELFARDEAGVSQTVTLQAPPSAMAAGLPAQLRVRFVTVRLSTGELEVLATSLLEEERYRLGCFGPLYAERWGIETYYGVLKGRLALENFSGQTVEAILQDVHAAVFLSNQRERHRGASRGRPAQGPGRRAAARGADQSGGEFSRAQEPGAGALARASARRRCARRVARALPGQPGKRAPAAPPSAPRAFAAALRPLSKTRAKNRLLSSCA